MNLILETDSYKLTHWNQYPQGTTRVYSYFESRPGAQYLQTVFFGLQPLLRKLEQGISAEDIAEADALSKIHFGRDLFNFQGWKHILRAHDGKLPLRIKAAPEGLPVPTGNVLMAVENTDPAVPWLTNAFESFLTHVWYPATVATLSRSVKATIQQFLLETSDSVEGLPFMLHDFGYRGATGEEAAARGGAAHLVNFMGTDTLPALTFAMKEYAATPETLGFSVPATEHSVMTSLGERGEFVMVENLLQANPEGILSLVGDSYDIYRFVERLGTLYKAQIEARDGKVVVRPDSCAEGETPESVMLKLSIILWHHFGGTVNAKGYKVLNPKVGLLWGDGIDPAGIRRILWKAKLGGFSAENYVFGMGGGLLQKVNRDTQRFAFKCSAQERNGKWIDVQKRPLDASKASKPGRLALCQDPATGEFVTKRLDMAEGEDVMRVVFENGQMQGKQTFDAIRERAAL